MKKDYYGILGISKNATGEEIKKAYRRRATEFHPDLNAENKAFEEYFKLIIEAYEVLSNPDKRKEYDTYGYQNDNFFKAIGKEQVNSLDGYCKVEINEKYGIVDLKGNWIIQPIYDLLTTLSEEKDYFRVEINEKWGVIDLNGNWIIQPIYDARGYGFVFGGNDINVGDYYNAEINGKIGLIDLKGNWIIQPIYYDLEGD